MATIDGWKIDRGCAIGSPGDDDGSTIAFGADIACDGHVCVEYWEGKNIITAVDVPVAVLREVLRRIDEGDADEVQP